MLWFRKLWLERGNRLDSTLNESTEGRWHRKNVLWNTRGESCTRSTWSRPFSKAWQHKNHRSCQKGGKKNRELPNIDVLVWFTCKKKVRTLLFDSYILFYFICCYSRRRVRNAFLIAWLGTRECQVNRTRFPLRKWLLKDNGKGGRVKPSVNMAAAKKKTKNVSLRDRRRHKTWALHTFWAMVYLCSSILDLIHERSLKSKYLLL